MVSWKGLEAAVAYLSCLNTCVVGHKVMREVSIDVVCALAETRSEDHRTPPFRSGSSSVGTPPRCKWRTIGYGRRNRARGPVLSKQALSNLLLHVGE
jgi:hypothetical protein